MLVKCWMEEAQKIDADEDARFGKGKNEKSLPERLATANQRLDRIRQAKQELEEEAKKRIEEAERAHPRRKPGLIPKQGATRRALTPDEQQLRDKLKSRLKKARRNQNQPTQRNNFTALRTA